MLTNNQDDKTFNILFNRYPNARKFDNRDLNEDIPQETKRISKLFNVTRTVFRKQIEEQRD